MFVVYIHTQTKEDITSDLSRTVGRSAASRVGSGATLLTSRHYLEISYTECDTSFSASFGVIRIWLFFILGARFETLDWLTGYPDVIS